jgi:hypothetical protein
MGQGGVGELDATDAIGASKHPDDHEKNQDREADARGKLARLYSDENQNRCDEDESIDSGHREPF